AAGADRQHGTLTVTRFVHSITRSALRPLLVGPGPMRSSLRFPDICRLSVGANPPPELALGKTNSGQCKIFSIAKESLTPFIVSWADPRETDPVIPNYVQSKEHHETTPHYAARRRSATVH